MQTSPFSAARETDSPCTGVWSMNLDLDARAAPGLESGTFQIVCLPENISV